VCFFKHAYLKPRTLFHTPRGGAHQCVVRQPSAAAFGSASLGAASLWRGPPQPILSPGRLTPDFRPIAARRGQPAVVREPMGGN